MPGHGVARETTGVFSRARESCCTTQKAKVATRCGYAALPRARKHGSVSQFRILIAVRIARSSRAAHEHRETYLSIRRRALDRSFTRISANRRIRYVSADAKTGDDRGARRPQEWARSALRRLGASGAIRQSADPGQPEHRQPNRGSTLRRIRNRRGIGNCLGTSHRPGIASSGSVRCTTDRREGNRPSFNEPRPKARNPRASSFPRNDPRAFVDATQRASWRRRRIHH